MSKNNNNNEKREVRSFLMSRDPSVDRRCRPRPEKKMRLFNEIHEINESGSDITESESEYNCVDDETSRSLPLVTEAENEIETGPLVYLRLRPVEVASNTYTVSECGTVLITGSSTENNCNNANKCNVEKHYSFSCIFNSEMDQRDVYEKCVGQKIQDEESFTIMTYGTSGSGKTYTLLGNELNTGIVPRALENIFTIYAANIYPQPSIKLINGRLTIMEDDAALKEMQIRRRMLALCPELDEQYKRLQQIVCEEHSFKTNEIADVSVLIWVSFVEIYNEFVYDLLAAPPTGSQAHMVEPPRKNLKIVVNNGQVFIKGLTSIYVKHTTDALKLLHYGLQRLTYASTAVNTNSSRSHCIFYVDILKFYRTGVTTHTSYKFCDLAGSERLDKTGNIGSRLKEAQRINTSLMVLGRCLDAASNMRKKNNNDVIPLRESKLTMLLQSPLLGKEKLTMIVTVTPLDKYYEENLNVLSFASIAKNIVFKQPPVKHNNSRYSTFMNYTQEANTSARDREHIERLKEEKLELLASVEMLQAEIERLKAAHFLEKQELEMDLRKKLTEGFQETLKINLDQCEQRLEKRLFLQKREYEAKLESQKRKHEEEIEDLRDEYYAKLNDSDVELIEDENDDGDDDNDDNDNKGDRDGVDDDKGNFDKSNRDDEDDKN